MPSSFDIVAAEDIAKAHAVFELVELRGVQVPTERKVSRECHACDWSNDKAFFAWSRGKILNIIQWRQLSLQSDNLGTGALTINVGQHILSMAFSTPAEACTGRRSYQPDDVNNNRYHFYHPDELTLAVGLQNGRIKTYGVSSGKLQLELIDHTDSVCDIKFAPDGSMVLASASRDGRIKFWNLNDDGNMFLTLDTMLAGRRHAVYACCWSPCARLLATAGALKHVIIWDVHHGNVLRRLVGHHHDVVACMFSPDGVLLATSSYDTTAIVWDHQRGEKICVLGHLFPMPSPIFAGGANDAYVRSVAFSRDGLRLVTVADDRYIRFWDLSNAQVPEAVSSQMDGTLLCCSYSPDGTAVATGNSNGDVTFFATASSVQSLSQLSRRVIRQALLNSPLAASLELLHYPHSLRSYLQYGRV